jgi:hypothetical protein
MISIQLLTSVSVFGAHLAVATRNLLRSVAEPLTVPVEHWIPSGGTPSSTTSLYSLLSQPESSTVSSVLDRQQGLTTSVLSAVDFGSMLDFPEWTDGAFTLAGLVLLVLGMMAWLGSHSDYRRAWGRRMAFSGGGLFVVGTAFGTFVDLLQYVLG